MLRDERVGHTLQPTALVNEVAEVLEGLPRTVDDNWRIARACYVANSSRGAGSQWRRQGWMISRFTAIPRSPRRSQRTAT